MKNIFKFNRVFSVILLLSVVSNASAVRWFEDGAFTTSADIANERFIAAKRAEAQANFARVDAARAAEAAADKIASKSFKTALDAEAANLLDAEVANLMEGFGVSEGHIKAEVSAPAVAVKPTWTFGGLWNSATSKLSTVGSAISSGVSRGYTAAAEQVAAHPTATKAVIGVGVVGIVGYMLYKRNHTKTAAITTESAPAPVETAPATTGSAVIGQTATTTESATAPVAAPEYRHEYQALANAYLATGNKANLQAISTSFNATGKNNKAITFAIGAILTPGVKATVDNINAKLAELIAA